MVTLNKRLRDSIESCDQCEEEENGMIKMCFKHQYIVKQVVPEYREAVQDLQREGENE